MSKTDQGQRQRRGEELAGARPKPPFEEQHQESRRLYITGTVVQVMGGETTGA
jgi:hypothetical protein